MIRYTDIWTILLPCALLLWSCSEEDGGESGRLAEGVTDTADVATGRPSGTVPVRIDTTGRTELPTYNTGAGPLFISLPKGFSVRADRGLDYDMLFLYHEDDPVIHGNTEVPPRSLARIQISDSIVTMAVPGAPDSTRKLMVAGVPAIAERYEEPLAEGGTYRSYVIELKHFFAARDRALNDLHLHLYVGGSDTAAVESLLTVLTTLSFQP